MGYLPTLPITAVVLKRHPEMIQDYCRQGIPFDVHGYVHIDYGVVSMEEQVRHFRMATDAFQACGVPFKGFRAPFLRINDQTFPALSEAGFPYDSSCAVHWDVVDSKRFKSEPWSEYGRALYFYQSRPAEDSPVLPRFENDLVEIPVSLPDDEIALERLGIDNEQELGDVWSAIVVKTYEYGELNTIQLHPERIMDCDTALITAVTLAKRYRPPVWIATLEEIANWWRERAGFVFHINERDSGKYKIKAECSGRATVLVKNSGVDVPAENWYDGYMAVSDREFTLECPKRPVIGVTPDADDRAIAFLKSEGFVVETGDTSGDYALYFHNLRYFDSRQERVLLARIEHSGVPLLRYWRWPDNSRSALSVTGDVDSITLMDFFQRILESFWEDLRQWRQRNKRNKSR